MKKSTLLFAMSLILSGTLFASHLNQNSVLEISLWDHSSFSIELDYRIQSENTRTFRMEGLRAGNHHIRILKKTVRPNGFLIKEVYRGPINIPAKSNVKALIDKHRNLKILSVKRLHSGNQYGINSHNGHNGSDYGYNQHSCSTGFSEHSFFELKKMLKRADFDRDRLLIAKEAVQRNGITSRQVEDLMHLFDFESNRLEFAKFAYKFTSDRQNYFVVNRAFDFSSSIKKLTHYINTNPH